MVRPKLQLEKLDGHLARDHYYLQNKSTVTKKIKEMSILTETDTLFLSFSPNGIPSVHLGQGCDFMEIMRKFLEVPFHDREKRRLDNLQTLRTNYQKEGYNIDVHRLFHSWKINRLQSMEEELQESKEQLNDHHNKRSSWENPENVNSAENIKQMEKKLKKALEGIRKRKTELMDMSMSPSTQISIEPSYGIYEEYIPEMLSGNDDMLAYANILMSRNPGASSSGKHH